MTAHRAVIEIGPGAVRRLCCGTAWSASAAVALECIDDPVALVDGRPVAVAALWDNVLRSLACPDRRSVLVIHPSWWSASRVGLITDASRTLADDVVTRPRSQLLAAAAPGTGATVVIEIAARLVAITSAGTVAEARRRPTDEVAEAVVRRVVALSRGAGVAVVIDSPDGVAGAAVLATMIAARLRDILGGAGVEVVDKVRLAALAAAALPAEVEPESSGPEPVAVGRRRAQRIPALLACAGVLGAAAVGLGARGRLDAPAAEELPMTFLVEGRVALQVPEQWQVQRVTTGPGSARVEVISPSDPQVVLHMTQSMVPWGTLSATAESLKDAMDRANAAEPAGVFVDFEPSGVRAGRSAVTYREVREGHHIDWAVLVDGLVRISIGCQSRPDGADAVRVACERAVRSARALG